jgi:hypothetical protein
MPRKSFFTHSWPAAPRFRVPQGFPCLPPPWPPEAQTAIGGFDAKWTTRPTSIQPRL